MPGRRQHTPRTIRSIFTPALEASYSSAMISGSSRAFIFATRPAFLPALAASASFLMAAMSCACMVNGDCHRWRSRLALPRPVSCMNTSLTSAHTSSFAVNRPKSVYRLEVRR